MKACQPSLFSYTIVLMGIWMAVFGILISSFILSKSADLLILAIVRLSRKFHISEFNMGFFILGFATTTPELFVGINSIISNHPQLALGNLIGASIILLTLIVGLQAIAVKEIRFINTFKSSDLWFTTLIIALPSFLLFDGSLTRFDGILVLGLFMVFFIFMNRRQTLLEHVRQTLETPHNHILKNILLIIAGIAGLAVGAKIMVMSGLFIADVLKLPEELVGLLMLAIGTNLPELTVLFKVIKHQHKNLGLGDFLGSAVANTLVLGLLSVIQPTTLEAPYKVYFSFGILYMALIFFNAFFRADKKITRNEGIALVALYSFFVFSEVFLKNRL